MNSGQTIAVIASVVIALFSMVVGLYSARQSSKATTLTTRMDMEKEAFVRAREHYTETIESQRTEIKEQHDEIADLKKELKEALTELDIVKRRLHRVEQGLPPETPEV